MQSHALSKLWMVGPFPPPMGGAAKINSELFERFLSAGIEVQKLETSASKLAHQRSLRYHFERICANILVDGKLMLCVRRNDALYVVPDGGFGIYYTFIHVLFSRLRNLKLFFHHHTSKYLVNKSLGLWLIYSFSRSRATHVFLTPGMRDDFEKIYGPTASLIAQNASFTQPQDLVTALNSAPVSFGHLSNLCDEKGIYGAIDTFKLWRASYGPGKLFIAGPILEEEVQTNINTLIEQFGEDVVYLGVVSGEAKLKFYQRIDIFLFPSKFKQEASPNVLFEAAAAGNWSFSTRIGYIPEIYDRLAGAAYEQSEYSRRVVQAVALLNLDKSSRPNLKEKALSQFISYYEDALVERQALIDCLLSVVGRG